MPITQAKTGHNVVAAARGRDAIGMIVVGVGMIADLAEMDDHKAKAGATNGGNMITIVEVWATSGAAILATVNLSARRRRSWI